MSDSQTLPRVLFLRAARYYEVSDRSSTASHVAPLGLSIPFAATWANVVYAHGETRMDYFAFRVFFRDGTHLDVIKSGVIDFIPYPDGRDRRRRPPRRALATAQTAFRAQHLAVTLNLHMRYFTHKGS
jgi:hypothetical protein